MDRKKVEAFASIPKKANQTLSLVFIGLLIIVARLWHLTVVQHDDRVEKAARARKKIFFEPAMRGTIRDRFHITLACNAIEYRVGVVWPPIQEIPRKASSNGQKRNLRKEYVSALSRMLAKELSLDPTRIEDIVYSHAVFSQNTPVVIKTGISEKQYYRLNLISKDWPGLVVEQASRRIYPRGRSGCHVVGYTAPLNRQEFDGAISEIRSLKEYVGSIERGDFVDPPNGFSSYFSAKERLSALERRSYNLNDEIGKIGIEASYETHLRGVAGKKQFYTNAFGETIREEEESREPVPGKRVVLSLSSELQEWCESLLAMSEVDRYDRMERNEEKIVQGAKNPFIRGGAIIAIDPRTAEIVACASYPRFDPNDFVRSVPALCGHASHERISRWLEDTTYIQKVWDLEWPLWREEADETKFHDKELWLTWDRFLQMVLPVDAPYQKMIPGTATLKQLIRLQEEQVSSDICLDLTRLIVRKEELSGICNKTILGLSIDSMRSLIGAKVLLANSLKSELKKSFQEGPFVSWRKEHESEFLSEKRTQEKTRGAFPKPYLHYLDAECARQFHEWWSVNSSQIIVEILTKRVEEIPSWVQKATHTTISNLDRSLKLTSVKQSLLKLSAILQELPNDQAVLFLTTLKGFDDLSFPLRGTYSSNIRGGAPKSGQDLIRSICSLSSPSLASFCYSQPSAQGSIFKLVVAYAALHQRLRELGGNERNLSPNFFRISDHFFKSNDKVFVGVDDSGKPIPQMYRGGRIPKSAESNIGEVDLVKAIGRSSNPYFALLASDFLETPTVLLEAAKGFGYGEKTGIALPSESPGRLPQDLLQNKTGVYTTAIGQHTLTATPLQTSIMLATLANGGEVVVPKLVKMVIGSQDTVWESHQTKHRYASILKAIGIDSPLFLLPSSDPHKHQIHITSRKVKRHIDITKKERSFIFEGMLASFERAVQDNNLKRLLSHRPGLIRSLDAMRPQIIGKSSTAEASERLGLGIGQKPVIYNHTWFGGIFFPHGSRRQPPFDTNDPELIVVVFLRYGTFGKDAAPIAASVAHRWSEIQKQHDAHTH